MTTSKTNGSAPIMRRASKLLDQLSAENRELKKGRLTDAARLAAQQVLLENRVMAHKAWCEHSQLVFVTGMDEAAEMLNHLGCGW